MYKRESLMLWELVPRVLDKYAMPLQAYRLRPTGLGIQTNCIAWLAGSI